MRKLPILLQVATLAALLAVQPVQAAALFDVAGDADLTAATVQMSHLPAWVQVVSSSAPLYVDDAGQTKSTTVKKWTYLRVLAGGSARLQVQAYDEAGLPGPRAWVDPDDILPAAPGINWLVTARATTLYTSDTATRPLDAFLPLQQIDGPVLGRVDVRVFSTDLSKVVDQGWVDVADTGPALAPQTRVAALTSATARPRTQSDTDQQSAFLDAAAQAALSGSRQTGVPASVTVAQAILESDWGRSLLATSANNYFGIKANGGLGDDGLVWMPTSEFDADGQAYQTVSPFRAYKSLSDSMQDHDALLARLSRYAPAMHAASDPREFAQLLVQGGYSTDPAYADKLIALMDRYDLYRLDS